MSDVLWRWNGLTSEEAMQEILACCGSAAWARELVARRPLADEISLVKASDEIWSRLGPQDWREAFARHPRIGEQKAPPEASAQSAAWSAQEQRKVALSGEVVRAALLEANWEYEQRFGRVFIVCASGKSAAEILEVLQRRLRNDEATELREAAEEQRKITNLRLQKWLCP